MGVIVPTIAYHVPLNALLSTLDPANAGAVQQWADYADGWTRWNHVRAGAALAAAGALVAALMHGASRS